MVDPVKDRRPRPTPDGHAWVSVDGRSVLSAADQEVVDQFRAAVRALDQLGLRLGPTLSVIRDNLAGQPASGLGRRGDGPSPWCWDHEQTVDACSKAGHMCLGQVIAGPSDPTGTAALGPNPAARHHRDLVARARLVVRVAGEIVALAAGYPVDVTEIEDEDPSPGEDLCRCCWKDGRYAKDIDRKASGAAYYAGLCRWCGQQRALIQLRIKEMVGHRIPSDVAAGDPPTWMVEMHHRGQRIMPSHITRAAQDLSELAQKLAQPKGKKRRKK